jgi:hypothetical protein
MSNIYIQYLFVKFTLKFYENCNLSKFCSYIDIFAKFGINKTLIASDYGNVDSIKCFSSKKSNLFELVNCNLEH